jgi:hypothetical protein
VVAGDHFDADAGRAAKGHGFAHACAGRVDHALQADQAERAAQVVDFQTLRAGVHLGVGEGEHAQSAGGHAMRRLVPSFVLPAGQLR